LRNISLSGCYLETPRPVPEGARVRVVFQLAEIRADVWGVVRRRDEKGLGIQFTNGANIAASLLQQLFQNQGLTL